MKKTNSYTYFSIGSNGIIDNRGLVATEKGVFDPAEITKLLTIQPFKNWSYGDERKNGTTYLFSSWSAEKSDGAWLDIEGQCLETIRNLKDKIPMLKKIKEQYDVNFVLMIVPSVHGEEAPVMSFNRDIIEFCYLTETTIEVDFYMYPEG